MKRYLNLLVTISPLGDGQYEARVSSEQGAGRTRFTPPFRLADVISHAVGPSKWRNLGTVKPITPELGSARECGVALFETLFTGEARDVLVATEAQARALPDTGVRIRLAFDLTNPFTAEVAALPWELMRRRNDDPLVVTMQTALVRALDVPKPITPRPFIKPLRILVIRSNPEGTGALNLAREGQMLVDALKRLQGVSVDEVAPHPAAIRDQLARADYHVVHYMGHGDFQADRGGMLLLENEDRSPHLVSAATFAAWLKDEPLRLVFLNACETGTTPDGAGPHPFAGVAAALIQSNTPAVVAMQFPISDDAAVEFARTFYTRIADGFPVDAAVAEGRKALFDEDATEWATPVLYLRPDDGNLFADNAAEPRNKAAPPPPEPAPVPPPLKAADEPQKPNNKRTIYAGLGGAAAMLLAIIWLASGEPEAPASDAEAPAADAAATDGTPAVSTEAAEAALPDPIVPNDGSVAANAFNSLPRDIWINDNTEPFAHRQVISKLEGDDQQRLNEIETLAGMESMAAKYVLAEIYRLGALGLENPDNKKNFELLTSAADMGLPAAQYWVGYFYSKGTDGFPKDIEKARAYLEKAKQAGNLESVETLKSLDTEQ